LSLFKIEHSPADHCEMQKPASTGLACGDICPEVPLPAPRQQAQFRDVRTRTIMTAMGPAGGCSGRTCEAH
jgi:hypothetical protein